MGLGLILFSRGLRDELLVSNVEDDNGWGWFLYAATDGELERGNSIE